MAAMTDTMPSPTRMAPTLVPGPKAAPPVAVMSSWLRAQSINVTRHAAALRPFKNDEFGTGAQAPTAGHLQAVNDLISKLRSNLLKMSARVTKSAPTAHESGTPSLQDLMRKKEHAHIWVRGIEKIWDFYFELFGQRQSRYAKWLLSCDRMGLDC